MPYYSRLVLKTTPLELMMEEMNSSVAFTYMTLILIVC